MSGRHSAGAVRIQALSGEIPRELGQLTDLEYLNLGDNELSGEIPPEIGAFANLSTLSLWGDQLKGDVPSEPGQLTQLTDLFLEYNDLSGMMPPELGRLTKLTRLDLGGNEKLAGPVPRELTNLTMLSALLSPENVCVPWGAPFDSWIESVQWRFDGSRCPPSDVDPHVRAIDRAALEALYRATDGDHWHDNSGGLTEEPVERWADVATGPQGRVIKLDLSGVFRGGVIPAEIGQLASLEYLDLSRNRLTGTIPAELGQLASLTYLSLPDNQLSGRIPSQLGRLASLTRPVLGDNRLRGTIPPELGSTHQPGESVARR